jgi:rhodanese-related sulfurtransferase/predicted transcriptional regulator
MQGIPREPDDFFKSFAYEQIARVGKAFSAPARLVLMNILNQGPHTVDQLAREADLSIANTSRHLQVLRNACLVRTERQGTHIVYSVNGDAVSEVFLQMKDLATRCLTDLQAALAGVSDAPTRAEAVGRDTLLTKVSTGESMVIDVRPPPEYHTAHLPGAYSVPLDQLERQLDGLPKDREIVAYCRGRYCVLADRAVEILRNAGFSARRSDVDVADWKRDGLPVEASMRRPVRANEEVRP